MQHAWDRREMPFSFVEKPEGKRPLKSPNEEVRISLKCILHEQGRKNRIRIRTSGGYC
jgi:hypothetical protein